MKSLSLLLVGLVGVGSAPARAQTAAVTPDQLVGQWELREGDTRADTSSYPYFRVDSTWANTWRLPDGKETPGPSGAPWHLSADTLWWGSKRTDQANLVVLADSGQTLTLYQLDAVDPHNPHRLYVEQPGDDLTKVPLVKRKREPLLVYKRVGPAKP